MRRRARRSLPAASVLTTSLGDETEILRQATRALVGLLDADAGSTWTLTTEGDRLVPRAGCGLPANLLEGLRSLPADHDAGLISLIRAHERAYGWDDSRSERCLEIQPWTLMPNHRSVLMVPLRRAGEVIGAMTLVWTGRSHHFTRDELDLVDAVAGQVTLSLENFRLAEQLRARQARLETLLEVNRQLSVIQPIESRLERIAGACGRVLDCGSVGIRVVDGDVLVLSGTYGDADGAMPTTRLEIVESLSGVVAATGAPLITNDLVDDPRLIAAHRRVAERLGYQAVLGVPVKLGDELLGVLSACTKRSGGFNEDDVAIATAFAAQAAAAIENARLYERARQAYRQMVAAQEQLVAAQKMEALGRLAGGIAHDFNNLLTVIAGRATLLKTDLPPGDRLRRHAELIQSTAWRAGSLTQQLLAFGRRQVLQPKVVQLNDIVRSMGTMLRPLIGEHNELVVTLEPELPFVKVDPAQLEQVVVNLVVNSRDAMPAGGRVSITTSTAEVTRDAAPLADGVPCGTWIRLSVSDTGIGIDAATTSHTFEPCFTTKGPGKGTGLGLATVCGIIEQSGGYLDVHGASDLGTTITVYLPAIAATPDDVPRTASGTMPAGTETILLVEDEEPESRAST